MKPPGYLKQVGNGTLSEDGKSAVFTFQIRRWHPRLWFDLLRYIFGWRP